MIKIETVLDILKKDGLFREIIDQGHYHYNYSHVVFDTICYDSRKAKEKSLFFVKGAAFKKEFLLSAISQGLGWYIAEKNYEVGIPAIIVSDIKKAMSLIAMEFYGNPQENSNSLPLLVLRVRQQQPTSPITFYLKVTDLQCCQL